MADRRRQSTPITPSMERRVSAPTLERRVSQESQESMLGDFEIPEFEILSFKTVKLFAISDVHCEQPANMQWILDLEAPPCPEGHCNILLAPGDIASGMKKLREALEGLKKKFQEVVFVPGNHELWSSDDSMLEMQRCADTCHDLGVRTKPFGVALEAGPRLWVLPLHSWYHHSWDKEAELPAEHARKTSFLGPFATRWGDFSFCRWPSLTRGADWKPMGRAVPLVARKMAALNTPWLKALALQRRPQDFVASLSHFLPRNELLPEKRFLLEPLLTKVSGSDFLKEQVKESGAALHVFGHTHIPLDLSLEGVRYVQWCLGSKHETQTCAGPRQEGPLALWDSTAGMLPPRSTMWTDYYSKNPRDPSNSTLAPWVEEHIEAMRTKYGSLSSATTTSGSAAAGERKRPPAVAMTKWNSFSGTRGGSMVSPALHAAHTPPSPTTPTSGMLGLISPSVSRTLPPSAGSASPPAAASNPFAARMSMLSGRGGGGASGRSGGASEKGFPGSFSASFTAGSRSGGERRLSREGGGFMPTTPEAGPTVAKAESEI